MEKWIGPGTLLLGFAQGRKEEKEKGKGELAED
jgi:hypothetical protein